MVSEKAMREEILLNLTRIKNEMTEVSSGVKIENEMKEVSSGVKSQWPIFHKVLSPMSILFLSQHFNSAPDRYIQRMTAFTTIVSSTSPYKCFFVSMNHRRTQH